MKKKDKSEYRTIRWEFSVNEKENIFIKEKMKLLGISSNSAYLRKMAIDGYIIMIDMSDVKEVLRLLQINSNNLNQYAKRANETGCIYEQDICELKESQKEILEQMRKILDRLSNIT